jgi:MFS family permease
MRVVPHEALLKRLWTPLKDSQFRRYIAYRSCWTVADFFCQWTWFLYMLDFLRTEKAAGRGGWWGEHMFLMAVIILQVGGQIGQFLGFPMWGRAVDRLGCKPVLFLSSTLHSLSWMVWIFLSPALLPWMFFTQIFGGFMFAGQDVASFNMTLRFNRRGGLPYQAMMAVIFSIAGAAAAAVSGKLADTVLKDFRWTVWAGTSWEHTFNRYAFLIAVAIGIKYVADLVFLPAVRDEGGKPARHALKFVFESAYETFNTVVFGPIRSGAEMTGLWRRK